MYGTIFSEIVGGFIVLFIVVRLLGKTQISQITPFDFISALVLGELVGNAIYDQEIDFGIVVFSIVIWGLLIYFTEYLTQKSRAMRFLFEGKPSMVIRKGKLDWSQMKKNQLDLDQLLHLLRDKGVFSLAEVEYAILEINGSISVLKKAEADQPTINDLKIKGEERVMPYMVISDGVILKDKLTEAGVDEEWLYQELKKQRLGQPEDICFAEYAPGSKLFVQKY